MSTFEDWKQDVTPDRKEVRVCLDRRLLSDLEAAEEELMAVPSGMLKDKRTEELKALIDDLREQIKTKTRKFVFESLLPRVRRDLEAEHPPTPEQVKEYGRLAHNPETFFPALLAASCVEPGLTEEEAHELLFDMALPHAVIDRIQSACLEANFTGSPDPKAGASAAAQVTAKK